MTHRSLPLFQTETVCERARLVCPPLVKLFGHDGSLGTFKFTFDGQRLREQDTPASVRTCISAHR